MNNPSNGPPAEGQRPSMRNINNRMEQWREQAKSSRQDYAPRIKQQVERQFTEYSPPLYASMAGYRRDWNLLVCESRLAGYAATLQREFTDDEAKALTEWSLREIHTNALCKWGAIGLAGYMTYRGRRTWQFPFYKPKMGGRFNPNEANSLFSSKKVRGFYPNLMWHTMRFTAYVAVTILFAEPVFRTINHVSTDGQMTKDPRLAQFKRDAESRVRQMMGVDANGAFQREMPRQEQSYEQQQQSQENFQYSDESPSSRIEWPNSSTTSTNTSWNQSSNPPQTPSQQSSDDWSVLDDDDDASPIASSTRSQTPVTSGGSAWDRIRQQSQPPSNPRGAQQAPAQQSQGGWGDGQSRESYTFSPQDEERSLAKEQAQAEFDRLIERERRGVDQEKSWGRR